MHLQKFLKTTLFLFLKLSSYLYLSLKSSQSFLAKFSGFFQRIILLIKTSQSYTFNTFFCLFCCCEIFFTNFTLLLIIIKRVLSKRPNFATILFFLINEFSKMSKFSFPFQSQHSTFFFMPTMSVSFPKPNHVMLKEIVINHYNYSIILKMK